MRHDAMPPFWGVMWCDASRCLCGTPHRNSQPPQNLKNEKIFKNWHRSANRHNPHNVAPLLLLLLPLLAPLASMMMMMTTSPWTSPRLGDVVTRPGPTHRAAVPTSPNNTHSPTTFCLTPLPKSLSLSLSQQPKSCVRRRVRYRRMVVHGCVRVRCLATPPLPPRRCYPRQTKRKKINHRHWLAHNAPHQ